MGGWVAGVWSKQPGSQAASAPGAGSKGKGGVSDICSLWRSVRKSKIATRKVTVGSKQILGKLFLHLHFNRVGDGGE